MKITVDKKFIIVNEMQDLNSITQVMVDLKSKATIRDIECELYEYEMIKKGRVARCMIFGKLMDTPEFMVAIDVKCIKAYYNVSRKKLVNIIKQRGIHRLLPLHRVEIKTR